MQNDGQSWLELTEFEHCEPSCLAFRALVALLDTWPGADQAAAIEQADKLLTTWPDAARVAPWSWCKAASQGQVQPTWQLCRGLELRTHHLSKGPVNLPRLAQHASLLNITELDVRPIYSDFQELSLLYHHPERFPAIKRLTAINNHGDGDVRALCDSPLWRTLQQFEVEELTDSLFHNQDASRIVPKIKPGDPIQHLALRACDLLAVWDANSLTQLRSVAVFVRSIEEARALAERDELARLSSLAIAFRCGRSGSSPFEPFLGNIIEADEAAADEFFRIARLDQLEELAICGYSQGYWGREGLGRHGLDSLIASGLLKRLKRLRLQLLPLGDQGVAALAPALGEQLDKLELQNVYCKGEGAAALIESPCLTSLCHLDLSANRIASEQVVRLANVEMPRLRDLDLSGPKVDPYYGAVGQQPVLDAGAAAWAAGPNAQRLQRLRLNNCFLTDDALTALFQSPRLQNLVHLGLSHNSFTAPAIEQVVDSPLWQSLVELSLTNCRLDNGAIEALTQVTSAPALRVLELGYNSIGPRAATALANWPVLTHVWHLDLHDNLIGDEGLRALAASPYVGRLLELDLEQDCWNSRSFSFRDEAAMVLANSQSFERLDSIYSGCVDEYHGTAYSPGFTKDGLNAIRKSKWMRPAFKAACSDFSGIDDYFEHPPFNEAAELGEQDIRARPYELNVREAEPTARGMQQVGYGPPKKKVDMDSPPQIGADPLLQEFDDTDGIEGIEHRDETPLTDHTLRLELWLEDESRPLSIHTAGVFSVTLARLIHACTIGYFESSGSGSREGEDGEYIVTDESFLVGIKGDPRDAVQFIRETLWWVGAPADTELDEFPLDLATAPATSSSRFLQLATPKVVRWKAPRPGHRIDRAPFSTEQREAIQRILADRGATVGTDGWVKLATGDGGSMAVGTKFLLESEDFDTLNILLDTLTADVTSIVYELTQTCDFMLFPMLFASEAVARKLDWEWSELTIVESPQRLHQLLLRGPYAWWKEHED